MIIDDLPRLRPTSTAGPRGDAALLIDEAASPQALYDEAMSRLRAAHGMLFTAATFSDHQGLDGRDVQGISYAAQLLTSDAMDLMEAYHESQVRRARHNAQQLHHEKEA